MLHLMELLVLEISANVHRNRGGGGGFHGDSRRFTTAMSDASKQAEQEQEESNRVHAAELSALITTPTPPLHRHLHRHT